MTSKQNPLSFLPGPAVDRTTFEGWNRWCETRKAFVPAPILTAQEYARLSKRQKRIHDLHRLATHSSLPIQATPMSERVAHAVLARVEDGAFSHKAGTRGGIMVNGDGAQGKTETICEALACFQEEWLALNNYANPDAMPGTRDLVAPVAYVRCPVKATPISTCQRILDFYGEDYKGMRLEDLVRTVKTAVVEHATKALVIDDITRLKLHREADQDVLDLIREMMSMPVTLILVGVGIPTSGLLREGRRDPKTQEWIYKPVEDIGRSPNDHAATQHERRFQVVDLGPFRYATPAEMEAWMVHLRRLEGELRLLTNTASMLTQGDMPEYLFNRTKGVVGILEKLVQHGCRRAMEDKSEYLTKDLLNQFTVTPDDMPDLDADSGEQPNIPRHDPTPKKKPTGRITVFDDDGPAAAGSAGVTRVQRGVLARNGNHCRRSPRSGSCSAWPTDCADLLLELLAETATEFAHMTRLSVSQVQDFGLRRYVGILPALRMMRGNSFGQYLRSPTVTHRQSTSHFSYRLAEEAGPLANRNQRSPSYVALNRRIAAYDCLARHSPRRRS